MKKTALFLIAGAAFLVGSNSQAQTAWSFGVSINDRAGCYYPPVRYVRPVYHRPAPVYYEPVYAPRHRVVYVERPPVYCPPPRRVHARPTYGYYEHHRY